MCCGFNETIQKAKKFIKENKQIICASVTAVAITMAISYKAYKNRKITKEAKRLLACDNTMRECSPLLEAEKKEKMKKYKRIVELQEKIKKLDPQFSRHMATPLDFEYFKLKFMDMD